MIPGTHRRTVVVGAAVLALALLVSIEPQAGDGAGFKDTMRFATEMAKLGNWREAQFRWQQASRIQPNNPKIINNLAVASEVLGEPEEAKQLYSKASSLAGGDPSIQENRRRFSHFWRRLKGREGDDDPSGPVFDSGEVSTGKTKGKTLRVPVAIPLPPRIELTDEETLLVTSFLTIDTKLLDTNRELVRYLRTEFRQFTDLEILDIIPPPAIPEQTLEDLLANSEFWRYLGRNYDADIIVSGVVSYDREDISGFQSRDYISGSTGQKVRTSEFYEQEQFIYMLDIFFVNGDTGEILFKERLQQRVLFQGTMNDPITAFYNISDSLVGDVLSVVAPRTRADIRVIFRK